MKNKVFWLTALYPLLYIWISGLYDLTMLNHVFLVTNFFILSTGCDYWETVACKKQLKEEFWQR
jgi:hypothetical protein